MGTVIKDVQATKVQKHAGFQWPIHLTLEQRRAFWAYVFLLVPISYLTVTRFIPIFASFNMSFRKWTILSPNRPWVGLDNYATMLTDARLQTSLENTLTIAILKVPLELVFALAIALLLHRIPKRRDLFRLIYFIPFMTIGPAVAKVWRWAFMPQRGPINLFLGGLDFPQQPFLQDPNQALYAMIAVLIWVGLGFSTVLMLAGLSQIPQTFYEAAKIDGANSWQLFQHITIPLLNPTLVLYTVTSTIGALQTFTMAFLLVPKPRGGYSDSLRTVMLHIYESGFGNLRMGYAAAITVSILIFMIVLTLIQFRILSRKFDY